MELEKDGHTRFECLSVYVLECVRLGEGKKKVKRKRAETRLERERRRKRDGVPRQGAHFLE